MDEQKMSDAAGRALPHGFLADETLVIVGGRILLDTANQRACIQIYNSIWQPIFGWIFVTLGVILFAILGIGWSGIVAAAFCIGAGGWLILNRFDPLILEKNGRITTIKKSKKSESDDLGRLLRLRTDLQNGEEGTHLWVYVAGERGEQLLFSQPFSFLRRRPIDMTLKRFAEFFSIEYVPTSKLGDESNAI